MVLVLHFQELTRGMRIKDANGIEQTAMHVFTLAIEHVKVFLTGAVVIMRS